MRQKSKYNRKDHIPRKYKKQKAEDLYINCDQIVSYSFHKALTYFTSIKHEL